VGDALEVAYLAGIIDADGTIGVKRSTYGMRHNNGGQPVYSERICVKQVERCAVWKLKQLFGGSFYHASPSASRGRRLWVWQVTDRRAAIALAVLMPYLQIKRRQAENCLRLRMLKIRSKRVRVAFGRGHVGAAVRPPEIGGAMEGRYRSAKTLNRVGEHE
jgi:hypothetical protein